MERRRGKDSFPTLSATFAGGVGIGDDRAAAPLHLPAELHRRASITDGVSSGRRAHHRGQCAGVRKRRGISLLIPSRRLDADWGQVLDPFLIPCPAFFAFPCNRFRFPPVLIDQLVN